MESTKRSYMRRPAIESLFGTSCSTIYREISLGTFPKAVKISARSVGWPSGEIEKINAARLAGKSDDEIREIVAKIHEDRIRSIEELAGQA